jgi:Flp pilus assembly protein TadD
MNIEASPNDPQHYWLKAITLAKIGQKEEARIVAQEAFDRAPYIDFSQELLSSLK